jgi:hypothetical protein
MVASGFAAFRFFASGDGYPKLSITDFSISVRAAGVLAGVFAAGAVEIDARMDPGYGREGRPPKGWFFSRTRLSLGTLYAYCSGVDTAGALFQKVLFSVFALY